MAKKPVVKKCDLCRKKIEFKEKECDDTGLVFHTYCFRCCECGAILNENSAKIRGEDNKLYCGSHALYQEGFQPICKIYFSFALAYRVVF